MFRGQPLVRQRIHFGSLPFPLRMPGSQPRRARSLSARLVQLRESALGRFIEDQRCSPEWYEAAEQYKTLVYRWRLAMSVQVPQWVRREFGGSGNEMDARTAEAFAKQVAEWDAIVERCRVALYRAGAVGSVAIELGRA